jgi:hypothetical protein
VKFSELAIGQQFITPWGVAMTKVENDRARVKSVRLFRRFDADEEAGRPVEDSHLDDGKFNEPASGIVITRRAEQDHNVANLRRDFPALTRRP